MSAIETIRFQYSDFAHCVERLTSMLSSWLLDNDDNCLVHHDHAIQRAGCLETELAISMLKTLCELCTLLI